MALVLLDRVQQTGTANTTVSFTLTGSVVGFQSFAGIGNGNTTFYEATDVTGNWETGLGTYSTTGPTLTRTAILQSSNAGSAVTFSGTVNVFVTYPSSKSVNLDASGNVSPLGTVASGTWQGTTVGVAYGGTGVTASSGANSVVLRDANANTTFNNYIAGASATTASGGTTVLTAASGRTQILVGSTTHTFQLPNATTLGLGQSFIFVNNSSGVLTVKDNASTTVETVPSGGVTQLGAVSIATSAGSWGAYSFIPAAVDWGTNALNLASTVISGGTWNGGTIATGYGGTGLTTFTAANNAIYSTSSSALAAGTLPVAAGGTGVTTSTGTGSVVLSTRPTISVTGSGFTLQDATDTTKQANFDLSGLTTGTTYAYTLPAVSGAALATLGNTGSTQTFAGAVGFGATISATSGLNLTGSTGTTALLGTSATTGTTTIGGASQTGALTLGQSTVSQTVNISNSATASGSTKTINMGTGGLTGSTTNINIGSTAAATNISIGAAAVGTVVTVNGTLTSTGALIASGSVSFPTLTGTIAIGQASSTGTITLGQSTVSQTVNISNATTASGSTNTINIGASGAAGSTTNIAIGSTAGTSTTTLNGAVTLATALPIASGGTNSTATPTAGGVVYGTGTAYAINSAGTAGQKLISGVAGAPTWGSSITAGTAVNSTSGTSIDFTSIPSWVKRVTVMFQGVSTSGTSIVQIQLGTGSVTTSGYLGASSAYAGGSTGSAANLTTGFGVGNFNAATNVRHGALVLNNISGNIWSCNGTIALSDGAGTGSSAGTISLGGTLDRVRITTVNGTDTFDAGSVNILYE